MQVARVTYGNILGIEEYEFEAGRLNLIKGENEAGKSSVIRGLIAALGSGSQAKLLRNGTDRGEIVVLFDSGERIQVKVTPERGVERKGFFRDGTDIPKLQTWLKERIDSVSFNLVRFLRAAPEERLEWLLQIAPIHLPIERLMAVAGDEAIGVPTSADGIEVADPLKTLATLDTRLREQRRVLNRDGKKKRALAEQLETTLPKGTAEDCRAQLQDLKRRQSEVQSERLIFSRAADKAENDGLAEVRQKTNSIVERLRLDAQAKIDEIKARLESDISDEEASADEQLDTIRRDAKTAGSKKTIELSEREQPLIQEIARLEEVAEQQGRANTTRSLISQANEEAKEKESKSADLTKSIDALEALRVGLFSTMPVRGIEVTPDGQIRVDGVDFETLNGANQVRVAFQLAKAASPGGIVCLDGGLSELDKRHREHFESWAKKSGLQFFLTEVDQPDAPLHVEVLA